MPQRLADRRPPAVPARQLVERLVPPPHFAGATFDSYRPAGDQPSQAEARRRLDGLAAELRQPPRRRLLRRSAEPVGRGVYLDGGFGVGKTHLLAALWHAAPRPRAYSTFVELTHLVGVLGMHAAVAELADRRLLCIDEFELDDPGDTVLVSTLLGRLADAGVTLAATSNTLPDALGEGRFAAADFLREIQGLADRFDVLRVDGPDYRHRETAAAPPPSTERELAAWAGERTALDRFDDLLAHLGEVHPSRYGDLLDGLDGLAWTGVTPVSDQAAALRLVVLVDRAYDRDLAVRTTGVPLDGLFGEEILGGGYRKKYLRARSRLVALTRLPGGR